MRIFPLSGHSTSLISNLSICRFTGIIVYIFSYLHINLYPFTLFLDPLYLFYFDITFAFCMNIHYT